MSIVDGVGLVEWEGGLFTPDSALLPRVRWAFAQIRAEGGTITLNEAGRPYGVSSDTDVGRSGGDASGTFSGRSTVYYQWGRYLLYLDTGGDQGTPSAANPAVGPMASEHTQGIAIDCNAAQPSLRAKYFRMVGLENTISSESWHWAIRGPSQVDLTGYAWAASNVTPIPGKTPEQIEEEELMTAREDILNAVADLRGAVDALSARLDRIGSNADDAGLMQVYYVENGVAIAIDPDDSRPPIVFRSPEELQHERDLKRVTKDAVLLSAEELGQQLQGARASYEAKYPKAS